MSLVKLLQNRDTNAIEAYFDSIIEEEHGYDALMNEGKLLYTPYMKSVINLVNKDFVEVKNIRGSTIGIKYIDDNIELSDLYMFDKTYNYRFPIDYRLDMCNIYNKKNEIICKRPVFPVKELRIKLDKYPRYFLFKIYLTSETFISTIDELKQKRGRGHKCFMDYITKCFTYNYPDYYTIQNWI
jgi:hypothetical protein